LNKLISSIKQLAVLLCGKRSHKIIAAVLSVVVVLSVCASLIMPALSATEDEVAGNDAAMIMAASDNNTYDSILARFNSSGAEDQTNIAQYIDADFTQSSTDGSTVIGSFKIKFDTTTGGQAATKYLTFQLDEKIKLIDEKKVIPITGVINGVSEIVAFAMVDDNNKVIIEIVDDYLEVFENGFGGELTYDASISRNSEENGSQTTVKIGDQTIVIEGFAVRALSLSKSGVDNKDGTITWSVVVDNPGKTDSNGVTTPNDLNGYVISDTMFENKNLVDGSVTCDPNGGSFENGKFTFGKDSTEKKYTITYKTKLTDEQLLGLANDSQYIENKATIKDSDGKEGPSDTGEVRYELGYGLTKDGKLDYSDPQNPKINWTLTVNNKYNRPIDGLTVTDLMFPSDVSGITFDPADKVTGTLDGSVLTFATVINEGTEITDENKYNGDVTVSFSTTVTEADINNGSVTNKANLPEQNEIWKTVYTKPFEFSKYGYQETNSGLGKLNYWKIDIHDINVKASELNGYDILDDSFSDRVDPEKWDKVDANNFKIYGNLNGSSQSLEGYYTIDEETNKLTFNGFGENDTLSWISIEYWTKTDEAVNDGTNEEDVVYHNKAEIKKGDTSFGEGESDITWPKKEEVKPSVNVRKEKADNNYKEVSDNVLELPWKIVVTGNNGGTLADLDPKTLTDTMSMRSNATWQDIYMSDGIKHYITAEQLDNIKFDAKDSNWQSVELEKDVDYKIVYTESALGVTSFNIEFIETSEKLKEVANLTISYSTTAEVTNVDMGTTIQINNTVSGNTQTYTYEKIDKDTTPYAKYDGSVDIENQSGTTHKKQSKLNKVTIDGIDYYQFDYRIDVNKNGAKFTDKYTLYDTLPDGFKLKDDQIKVDWGWGNTNNYNIPFNDHEFGFYLENNILTIERTNSNASQGFTFLYSLIIEKDKFDKMLEDKGSVEIKNSLKSDKEGYQEITQTQIVERELLTKDSDLLGNYGTGLIKYQVDVNPERKELSTDDMIYLEDIIKASGSNPAAIIANLEYIKITEVNADGTTRVLDQGEYRYVFDNNPTAEGEKEVELDLNGISFNGSMWVLPDNINGGKYKVSVSTGDPNTEISAYVKKDGGDAFGSPIKFTTDSSGNGQFEFDADTSNTFKLGFDFYYGDSWSKVNSITFDKITTVKSGGYPPYAAKIGLTVPDGKYLRIEYQYKCSMRDGGKGSPKLINTVEVENSMTTSNTTAEDETTLEIDNGSGSMWGYGDGVYKLFKVDVGDYSTRLSASFNLYKYDSTANAWLSAIDFNLVTGKDSTHYEPTFSGDGNAGTLTIPVDGYLIKLDEKTLYRIEETNPPEEYSDSNKGTEKYFYTAAAVDSSALPDDVELALVYPLSPGGSLNVQNFKDITIRAQKRWADGDASHVGDSVEFMLYRSHSKSSTIPSGAEVVKIDGLENPKTVGSSDNWQTSWDKLPSGTSDGKPWYYYVKETKVTINGVESNDYTAYYSGNGKNIPATVTVTNTSGLTVSKVWKSNDGSAGNPTVDHIRFKLYRSKLPPSQVDEGMVPSDGELIKQSDSDEYFILNDSNGWTVTLKDLLPHESDDSSSPYYYYVIEDETNLTDNLVSYLGNGSGSTGLITITNKSTKIISGEMPSTGGHGTLAYTLTGGLIILCSAAAYIIRKRLIRE